MTILEALLKHHEAATVAMIRSNGKESAAALNARLVAWHYAVKLAA